MSWLGLHKTMQNGVCSTTILTHKLSKAHSVVLEKTLLPAVGRLTMLDLFSGGTMKWRTMTLAPTRVQVELCVDTTPK